MQGPVDADIVSAVRSAVQCNCSPCMALEQMLARRGVVRDDKNVPKNLKDMVAPLADVMW